MNHYEIDGEPVVLPNSIIERGRLDGRRVYIKRGHPRDGRSVEAGVASPRCAREADMIERLSAFGLGDDRLGLVTLVEVRPEDGIPRDGGGPWLTTGRDPVATAALTSVRGGRSRLPGSGCTGFQELPTDDAVVRPASTRSPVDLVEYCDIRLDRIQRAGYRWLTRARRERILETIDRLSNETDPHDTLVWSHGDYAPGNMLWDGHVLTPLDFAMAKLDRALKDVTYFLHRLDMMPIYQPARRWPVRGWTEAFLRGYGAPRAHESPQFQALGIRHLLCRLNTYVSRPPRNPAQALHDRWVRVMVRRQLMARVRHAG